MSAATGIEWTDHTFNIAWGCVKVSPGCQHCYADTLSRRYGHDVWGPAKTTARRTFGAKHWAEPLKWEKEAAVDPSGGVCPAIPGRLVFCSSMCDVFEDHPTIDAERAKLWPLIRATPHLTWQLLTKRPERIAANLPDDWGQGYPNVWLGTSIESMEYIGRADKLCAIPAVVRFLSCEPLLGPLDLIDVLDNLDWVIVGGESGPNARPMRDLWAADLRVQCGFAGVAFFLKQLGGFPNKRGHDEAVLDGVRYVELPSLSSPVARTGGTPA